ncbi:MAG: replication-associated recombination protein A [Candidatus Moranbacteria bacterium]|jgi:putative ATPase|nr:replication-associated recombination protein A [Candidatus Moranbacteria bacterium]MDX9855276.1 replication-associated recombination protein A [Candidatus Moranbacteria bacterium]
MNNINLEAPLASRMRPKKLEEFFGQKDLVGEGSYLRKAIDTDSISSMIFWGPPGSGKTTLASIIANETDSDFIEMSAVDSGVKKLKEVIKSAEENRKKNIKTILFIDEIHRWNKAQQDRLLPYVEKGILILIGATTENPSFEVNSALISRARVFVLHKLEVKNLEEIIKRALGDEQKGLGKEKIEIDEKTVKRLGEISNGDARMALNTLEAAARQSKKIDFELIKKVLQKTNLQYDKDGEEHYNIISALHKSMRGGDADAAVYWLTRMLEGGEDPIYIARRLVRFASEDVGLANNTALILANAVFDACQKLGMPECGVHLAQCVIYLSKSKKDITAYEAYEKARGDVIKHGNLPVPLHIRNAPNKLMKELEYGRGYKYTPKEDSSDQEYFPEKLKDRKYL